MKKNRKALRTLAGMLLAIFSLAAVSRAQDKPKSGDESGPATILKLEVVLSEYDGSKKLVSLPYDFRVISLAPKNGPRTILRMGVRVPVNVSTIKDAPASFQYMDVGTNLDCSAKTLEDGRYSLDMNVERSSIYFASPDSKTAEWSPGQPAPGGAPVVRQFRNSTTLIVRNGQKLEATLATDPVSGRVLKMEVTATAEK